MKGDMRLVKVEWWDHSSSSTHGWLDLDDFRKDAEPLRCVSVGWVVHEDKAVIVLVPHVYVHREGWTQKGCGDLTIVKKAIHKIKVLKG